MDKIKEIVLAFCAVSVFSAAAGILNGKSLAKSGRYIIGLVFICALIACFKDSDFSIEIPENAVADYSENYALYEQNAEYLIAELLKENSITFKEISSTATKNESGDIVIKEITICGAEDREGVMAVLNSCGIDCRVNLR